MSFSVTKLRRRHCEKGRELLLLEADLPEGELPAATHLRQVTELLLDFAADNYLPRAQEALRQAAAEHATHRFFSYRYRVKLQKNLQSDPCRLTLTATLMQGNELLLCRRLDTFWSKDLMLQLPPPVKRTSARSKAGRHASPAKKSK